MQAGQGHQLGDDVASFDHAECLSLHQYFLSRLCPFGITCTVLFFASGGMLGLNSSDACGIGLGQPLAFFLSEFFVVFEPIDAAVSLPPWRWPCLAYQAWLFAKHVLVKDRCLWAEQLEAMHRIQCWAPVLSSVAE